jgi:uncharacterized membrane protein YbhN (UPF0104 family)
MFPRVRPSIRIAIQIALSVGVLRALFFLVDPRLIADALLGAERASVMIALLLVPVSILLTILVWWTLLRLISTEITFRSASAAVMAGYTLALLTPARVGEAAARIYYHRELGKGRLLGAFAVQGIYRTALYAGGGGVAIYYAMQVDMLSRTIWIPVLVFGMCVTLVLVTLGMRPRVILATLGWLPFLSKSRAYLDFLTRLSGSSATQLFALSTLRYAVTISQFTLLFKATGVVAATPILLSGAGFVFFIKSFIPNLLFTDLGLGEGAAALFFQSLGDYGPAAVAAALGLFGLNAVLPAMAGLPVVWMRIGKIRRSRAADSAL